MANTLAYRTKLRLYGVLKYMSGLINLLAKLALTENVWVHQYCL